jgi:hypothetical protein
VGPTPEAIRQLLEDIPSDSDISGADDDSGDDETYVPRDEEAGGEDEDDQDDPDDLGGVGDVAGAGEVDELPDLPEVIPPEDPVGAAGAAVPPAKKARRSRAERVARIWVHEDLPPQQMPQSTVKPKDLGDCTQDVHYFLKMFGLNNFFLITYQTNIVRAKISIERNRPIPAFSEKEIRQCLGILMYMSVVSLPSIKLYWKTSLKNSMVANCMTRDRFQMILSCLHLSENSLQPASGSPGYDRLYKVSITVFNLRPIYSLCSKFTYNLSYYCTIYNIYRYIYVYICVYVYMYICIGVYTCICTFCMNI